ncbi:MAG: class I SAM-dependent methyltransferase [Proteobacteria bacterium]|nr:class I SAM-dependent methyltransferase [Pseudomonadota bacterium]
MSVANIDLDSYLIPSAPDHGGVVAPDQSHKRSRPGASETEIQRHYDIGNDFYRRWLGETMAYSAALWSPDRPDATLEEAQRNKVKYHVDQALSRGARRVLDCGCGWGAILEELSQVRRVPECTGITLSSAQVDWIAAQDWPGVQPRLESWQSHEPAESYDAIIACGVLEHAADPTQTADERIATYRHFFERCHRWSRCGARVSLQFIAHGAIGEAARARVASLTQQIFPGTAIPRLQEVLCAAEDLFHVAVVHNHARDYARTCHIWRARLRENERDVVGRWGSELYAQYCKYLMACEAGFTMNNLALYRMTVVRNRAKAAM